MFKISNKKFETTAPVHYHIWDKVSSDLGVGRVICSHDGVVEVRYKGLTWTHLAEELTLISRKR